MIYILSIVNIISFIIFVLSLKILVNVSVKIHVLEKPNKIHHIGTQIQTEKFNGDLIAVLHHKNRERHTATSQSRPSHE